MSEWICTGECRYVTGMEVISDHDGITSAREFKQLQQKWIECVNIATHEYNKPSFSELVKTGRIEWRNVPVVSE
jgi:hypothetical protein